METITNLIGMCTNNPIKTSVLINILPLIGRGFNALKNGGGIKGLWKAIWSGVSVVKPTVI